jgi:RNA polymerase sigma factor (sigma-70 family)
VFRRWAEQAEYGRASNGMSQAAAPADIGIERAESARALQRAIEALPARTRLALVLRWEHSLSHAAVADAMGISVKGVEKLVATAMRKLRGHLLGDARDSGDAGGGGTR